ncbi:MAG TPA: PEGA domain-containing protein [Terriglobales bacterium]|nr:PEGA domain-containing protein [Terriglobales bacterium]
MRLVLSSLFVMFSLVAIAAEGPRVYVEESSSWEVQGHSGGSDDSFGGEMSGGARPQTAEIIKTFSEKCGNVVVNNRREKADYVVLLHHEGGKDLVRRDNKVVVFNRDGDAILSRSTRTLGNAVGDACQVINRDWALAKPAVNASVNQSPATVSSDTKVEVSSSPVGADIEVNGKFVGNTPSAIHLTPGEYRIAVKKNGYTAWEREVKVTGGNVTLLAELEKLK